MKKAILGLSGLVVLTFVIIFAVNAQNGNQQDKSKTSKGVTCCATITKCFNPTDSKMTENSIMKCDPANCKGGKCDPATCKGKNCDPSTCKTNCGGTDLAMKCRPMNCIR